MNNTDLTVTFFSNYLNHHQKPFCNAMVKWLGGNFRFVATTPISEERKKLGYRNETADYALDMSDPVNYETARWLAIDSDVVIGGIMPESFLIERMKLNKLTFRYSERFFKKGRWRILDPRVFMAHLRKDFAYRGKNLYMLCASAYTAPDCRFIFSYPNKTYRFGYFPRKSALTYAELSAKKEAHEALQLIWVGRLIGWKHPESAIEAAAHLKRKGIRFHLKMIGTGDLQLRLSEMIMQNDLAECVEMTGAMSPDDVRNAMEKADIALCTSDHNEGWGAVVNETMASGCAVLASNKMGAVPFLIQDGVNGSIYRGADEFLQKLDQLTQSVNLRKAISKKAYKTISSVWNADIAAERLIKLACGIINSDIPRFSEGPCSRV